MPSFSSTLEAAIHNALGHANQRKHELATLEHLLLALLDEPDAARVMKACGVDLDKLRKTITAFLDEELDALTGEELSPLAMTLYVFLATAETRLRLQILELGELVLHRRSVGQVFVRARVEPGLQHLHRGAE